MAEHELADYIGRRVLADADKLRLFVPDCYAYFPLEWCGHQFEIHITLKGKATVRQDQRGR
jgi:Ni,Fe-hydrogenase III component G